MVLQKMKSQQPLASRRDLADPTQMVENATYCPYMQTELIDLMHKFYQQPREPLAAWLLCLWGLGVGNIMCTDNEMESLASIITHPSLHQWLQNSRRHGRGRAHTHCWSGSWQLFIQSGQMQEMCQTLSKWQSFADLMEILWELGMHQGPDDECFTAGM